MIPLIQGLFVSNVTNKSFYVNHFIEFFMKSNKKIKFDLNDFLPYRLNCLSGVVSKSLAIQYQDKFSITVAQWRVLVHLTQHTEISIRDIHRHVDLDKVAVSRAVKDLEARGLLRKIINQHDKRLLSLSLSEQGIEMMEILVPLALDYQETLLGKLNKQETAFLDKIIRKLMR